MAENVNDVKDVQKVAEPVVEAVAEVAPVEAPAVPAKEEPVADKKAKAEAKPEAKPAKDEEQVGLIAERNLAWSGVGNLAVGFNLVTKKEADKWLGAKLKVRLATAEELKKNA